MLEKGEMIFSPGQVCTSMPFGRTPRRAGVASRGLWGMSKLRVSKATLYEFGVD